MLGLVLDAVVYLSLGFMVCNWEWEKWGRRARMAVPGSLFHAEFLRRRRIWRWPGFMFWPTVYPGWIRELSESVSEGSWWTALWVVLTLTGLLALRSDWRKLRRELDEDEDDWFNKGKKKLRKLARDARRSLAVRVPQPAHASF